jgi:uncharacterized protein YjiK
MKMIPVISTLVTLSSSLVLSLGASSCGTGQNNSGSPDSSVPSIVNSNMARAAGGVSESFVYDLEHPTSIYKMPEALTEISGISFHQDDDTQIYAEQDEKGRLYWLKPGDQTAKYYDFGKDGDYEDLAFVGKQAVLLKSNGVLYSFDFTPAADKEGTPVTGSLQEWKDLVPKGEYEGLFADAARNQLYLLCKDCKSEDHKKKVSVYRLDNDAGHWVRGAVYHIDVSQISTLVDPTGQDNGKKGKKGKKEKKVDFKPSALCQDPLTHQWYVLSSINKMLVVLGTDWQVKAVHTLSRKLYAQPEGICFDKQHNLYISNEGQLPGEATLLKFAPREQK